MQDDIAASMPARAALCRRLDALQRQALHLSGGALAGQVDAIRAAAAVAGLTAAARVAQAFSRTLAEEGRVALVGGWFAALADAIGCESPDAEAVADACVAAVMVRLH